MRAFFFTFCWRQVDIGLGEAPSKDIVCVLDEDKGSRVDALDEFQQVSQLANPFTTTRRIPCLFPYSRRPL